MRELCRFVNVCCVQPYYSLNGISFVLRRGESIGIHCDTISAKQCLIDLLLRRVEPTAGRVEWSDGPDPSPMRSCLISPECSCLFHDLSVAENLNILIHRGGLLFSAKRSRAMAQELLERHHISIDPSAPVYTLSLFDRYLLSILCAASAGATLLILSDLYKLLQDSNLPVLEALLRRLAASGTTIVFTECQHCAPLLADSTILFFENNHLVRTLHGIAELESFNQFRQTSHDLEGGRAQRHSFLNESGTPLRLFDIRTRNIRAFDLQFLPGEICYLVGKNRFEQELVDALFGKSPRFAISWGTTRLRSCSPARLKRHGIGYFPQNIDSILFPDLSYDENTAMLVLRQISRRFGIIRKSMFDYLSGTHARRSGETLYQSDYESRLLCCVSRFLLCKWRFLVLHLPSVLRSQNEGAALRRLIYTLAASGCGILIAVTSPSEIISSYDSRIEFDSSGRAHKTGARIPGDGASSAANHKFM